MFAQQIIHAQTGDFLFWAILLVALTCTGLIATFVYLHRVRVIEDTPASRIRSAAQGYVEFEGIARNLPEHTLLGPLTNTPCVWYEYQIHRYVRGGGRNNSGHWVKVRGECSSDLFELEDATGTCTIDPAQATVLTRNVDTDRWYGHQEWPAVGPSRRGTGIFGLGGGYGFSFNMGGRYRYSERRIRAGMPLYAIGNFTSMHATDRLQDRSVAIGALLRQWKQDQATLLANFDNNNDGRIDMREWRIARNVARHEVAREYNQLSTRPAIHMMGATGDRRRPFILSAILQEELIKRYRRYSAASLLLFLAAGAIATYMLTLRLGS